MLRLCTSNAKGVGQGTKIPLAAQYSPISGPPPKKKKRPSLTDF